MAEPAAPAHEHAIPPSPVERDLGHLKTLDAMRAGAALLVFAYHLTRNGLDFGPLQPIALGGRNGVTIFFVLSGFLLFEPFVRGHVDWRTYGVRRFLRIMPAYVLALVGLTVLTGDRSFVNAPWTYLLFLQNFDLATFQGFMAPAWTLVLEVAFYVTLPVIALVLTRTLRHDVGRPATALLAAGIVSLVFGWPCLIWLSGRAGVLLSSTYPFMFWAFVPGMLLALVAVRRPDALRPFGTWPMLLAGAVMLVIGIWSDLLYGNLFTITGSFLLIAGALVRRPSSRDVRGRGLAAIALAGATLSYSFYLWHSDLLAWLADHGFSGWWLAGVGLVIAGAISAVSYLIVERPAMRLGRRLSGGRRTVSAQASAHELAPSGS